jgi:hypothetical protein
MKNGITTWTVTVGARGTGYYKKMEFSSYELASAWISAENRLQEAANRFVNITIKSHITR